MQHYYVSKQEQSNGNHEIHVPRCAHLPDANDRIYLGTFTNCRDALHTARSHYEKSNGCYWCCNTCHTG